MSQLRYMEYNGQPVVSARDLYAFLTEGSGDNVGAWISFCAGHFLFTVGEDVFQVTSDSGHPDVLLLPTAAAVVCVSFRNTPDRARLVVGMMRELIECKVYEGDLPDDDTNISINQAAKILNIKEGPNTLYRILREAKILTRTNVPMQNYVSGGLFKVIPGIHNSVAGGVIHYAKTVVTPEGLEFIKKVIDRRSALKVA